MTKKVPAVGDIVVMVSITKKYRDPRIDTRDCLETEVIKLRLEYIDDCSPNIKLYNLRYNWSETLDKRTFGEPYRLESGWRVVEYEKKLTKKTIASLIKAAKDEFGKAKEKALHQLVYVNEMLESIDDQNTMLLKQLQTGELEASGR